MQPKIIKLEKIRHTLLQKAKKFAVKWDDNNVKIFIKGCLEDGGVPMFKDRFAGERFIVDGKPAVLGICYGGKGRWKDSQWFKEVPEEDIDVIESMTGEWKEFLSE